MQYKALVVQLLLVICFVYFPQAQAANAEALSKTEILHHFDETIVQGTRNNLATRENKIEKWNDPIFVEIWGKYEDFGLIKDKSEPIKQFIDSISSSINHEISSAKRQSSGNVVILYSANFESSINEFYDEIFSKFKGKNKYQQKILYDSKYEMCHLFLNIESFEYKYGVIMINSNLSQNKLEECFSKGFVQLLGMKGAILTNKYMLENNIRNYYVKSIDIIALRMLYSGRLLPGTKQKRALLLAEQLYDEILN